MSCSVILRTGVNIRNGKFGLESCLIDAAVNIHVALSQFLDLSSIVFQIRCTFVFGNLVGLVKLGTFLVSTT